MLHFRSSILICIALCIMGSATAAGGAPAPSDSDIRQILVNRIDKEKQGVGIVVGVIDAKGHRIVSYGRLEKGDNRPLDGDTLFEIGSITKVFTALLLTDMAQRGEVRLDDPISKYVPATVKIPQRDGKQITLVDLATHTSGLPRMPANFNPKDPANPYIDYTEDQLFTFLSSYELPRDIGVKFVYSNLGFGLLGQGLARRNGTDYETLVETRICEPLGMKSTRITLTPEMEQRFAAGHSADLVTVSRWDIPSLAGAGALRSSANDMLKFLAAAMGYSRTSLTPAFKAMLSVKRPTGQAFIDSALGWAIDTRGGAEIIWKNGGTGGYRTFIGYSPRTGVGIVALSNASTGAGTDDIGLHLLDARFPLDVPEGSPRETTVSGNVLDEYVGHYKLGQTSVVTISREGDQLYAELTGQPRAAIYAKDKAEFFYKIVDARISFQADAQGKTTALVLHQGGRDQTANRITDAEAKQLEDALAKRVIGNAAGGTPGVGGAGGSISTTGAAGGTGGAGAGGATGGFGSAIPATAAAETPATEPLSAEAGGGAGANINRIRIIANRTNNALLVYATPAEYSVIEGMLHKIDIIPLQVLIEATIAEVDLNDQLQYGTQFFFKTDHVAETLGSTGTSGPFNPPFPPLNSLPFPSTLPYFVLSKGPNFALAALANVTKVKVLSAPEVMVLDNQPARLQVGQQVPVLTGTATSTLAAGAPVVNSVDYHETGVIMQVTPRVNTGGLVSLDIAQEVSDVAQQATNTVTGSPTFDDQVFRTRVAVQDGQTVGMAGLIRDNVSQGNSGLPFLKDIPVLGTLFSTQANSRMRTELLVLITPHVVHDQRDARALTEDLRSQLINAGLVPQQVERQGGSGLSNPNGL